MATSTWAPLPINELETLLAPANGPFWISGGWAVDLFLARQTREHEDLDVTIRRGDLPIIAAAMAGWELHACDPPGSGTLVAWSPKEPLHPRVHNLWCRKSGSPAWNLELLLTDHTETEWIYRRNPRIRGPLETFGWKTKDGLRVLAPEIQLLYKSRSPRPKDEADLKNTLTKLPREKADWLKESIRTDSGAHHPWLALLGR